MSSQAEPNLGHRLGYLLKHAQLAFSERSGPALAHLGINGRELAVLTVLNTSEPLSQRQAAARLGLDRTTMVALVDELERKQLITRQADPHDRRRNLVPLTAEGQNTLAEGALAAEAAERAFLAALAPDEQELFRSMLQRILGLTPPK
jgi:DNA-binding MarR family transcriptional regulator